MVEAYAAQQLAIPTSEDQWQAWGAGMCAIDIFSNEGIPSPYNFDKWDTWATAVVNAVNPSPRTNDNSILA
jgi:hypothetical protein